MMQNQGSGGIAVVSFGVSESLLGLILLVALLFGLWKLAKLLWAAFSG